jgi:hypothetical protein
VNEGKAAHALDLEVGAQCGGKRTMSEESAVLKERSTGELGESFLAANVSFGIDVRRPKQLENRTAGDLLIGIRDGEWREAVESVRSSPAESSEQKNAKERLPYFTLAGQFSRRDARHLLKHSGLLGIDLDGLDSDSTRRVMHCALDDPHCAAAFRSARGVGVRLVVRVPPATAPQHLFVFDAAAAHVRSRYHVEPDASGRDVCRASFVSYDGGLWLNPQAVVLPVSLPELRGAVNTMTHCVNQPALSPPWWTWLARDGVPCDAKPDGTMLTHFVLLDLGKRLALRIERESVWRGADNIVEVAAREWFDESRRRGLLLRAQLAEYAEELRVIVNGARKGSWFRGAAQLWTRWTHERDFPKGDAKAAILFAVEHHCRETGTRKFFLSCRDAGTIIRTSHVRAAQVLNELCREGRLRRSSGQRPARHAAEFELLSSK